MKKVLLRALVSSLIVLNGLGGFCSFRLLKGPQGELFLLIGDLHDKEGRFEKRVRIFTDMLKNASLPKPLVILTEMPREIAQGTYQLGPTFEQLTALKKVIEKQEYPSGAFIYCDPRGFLSAQLEALREELITPVLRVATPDMCEKVLGKRPQLEVYVKKQSWSHIQHEERSRIMGLLNEHTMGDAQATVKAFFNLLDRQLLEIDALCKQYTHIAYYKTLREGYCSSYKILKELVEKYHEGRNFFEVMAQLCLESRKAEDLLQMFSYFDLVVLEGLDYRYANAVMLDHVLKATKTQPSCMVVGERHASELAKALTSVGWTCLDEAIGYIKVTPIHFGLPEINDFDIRFMAALQKVIDQLSVKEGKHCVACLKAPENLLRCGSCKNAHYCNALCQKADWPNHKHVCKKVPVKV